MKSQEEIRARQVRFAASYRFPQTITSPEMKAWTAAINASVRTRKYPVYSKNADSRKEAVIFWQIQLEKLGEKYKMSEQSKDQFLKDVSTLKKSIDESKYAPCFAGGEIRIGQCQKSLSIYLKWMWCLGKLSGVPPVCPIDGQVLAKCYKVLKNQADLDRTTLRRLTSTRWSNLNDMDTYEKMVELTEKVAKIENEEKTCVWELFAFEEPQTR